MVELEDGIEATVALVPFLVRVSDIVAASSSGIVTLVIALLVLVAFATSASPEAPASYSVVLFEEPDVEAVLVTLADGAVVPDPKA